MKDFNFYAPTEVAFGADAEKQIATLAATHGASKVLIHYGGKSALKSGLIDEIKQTLTQAGIGYAELGGVVPNPRLSKVYEGIGLCRSEGVDFILAVGGGSVIDSAKTIASGVPYEGDVWDFFTKPLSPKQALPIGVVLTIPAAGSEMSNGCVITKEEGWLKRSFDNNVLRPRFAVMNPLRTFTLPPYQTACGVTDIMMHTMERYFSHDDDMLFTDAVAEALMRTVKDCGMRVLQEPDNYQLRAQIMWAGSWAHNDLTGCGTTGDWATHMTEHELSAIYDVAHGAGLAALWPHWATYVLDENPTRFAQFAVNVMGVTNDFKHPRQTAVEGIRAMCRYYHEIGMPVSIPELIGRKATDEEIEQMATKCTLGKTITVGQLKALSYDDVANIYRLANK